MSWWAVSSHACYRIPLVYHRIKLHTPSRTQAIPISHCKKEESLRSILLNRLTAALLLLAVLGREVDDGLAGTGLVLARFAGVEGLAGDDAVNF